MKAEMNERGVITLSAESGIEAYALRQWADTALVQADDIVRGEGCYWRGSRLIVTATERPKD